MKILFITEVEWDSVFQIGEHYFARYLIEEGHDVMWLQNYWYPLSWKFEGRERFNHKFTLWKNGGINITKNLCLYAPFTLLPFGKKDSIFDSAFAAKHNINLTFPNLIRHLKKKNWYEIDILWIRNLRMAYLASQLSYKKLIYRMTDDSVNLSDAPNYLKKMQPKILQASDFTFISSRNVYSYANHYCNNVTYLPNGVDYNLFRQRGLNEPDELREIPHPRVAYVGALAKWTDIDLIVETARRLQNYNFIIIGTSLAPSEEQRLSCLKEVRNIFMLGKREHSLIPSYLKSSDVGIIPLKKNKFNDSPIKLYEYLAAGLPVVSVDLKETRNIGAPVYLVSNANEFAEAIVAAYEGGKDKREFFEFAKNNSWYARYKTVRKILGLR